jgi:NTP pyrophosphatase (non-canonical NTP hydrolase)
MTLQQLIQEYQKIRSVLRKKYPIDDQEKRIFANITKMVEEFGELAEVALAKSKLQRDSKNISDVQTKIEDEFADMVGTLMVLGLELDIDIEKALERKIHFTHQRLENNS